MYWQQEQDSEEFVIPDDVVDLAFVIRCSSLPVDHAQALSNEVQSILHWFKSEPAAGLHTIHGAESGNGWERPEAEGSTIYLSRRAKLTLRLPKERIAAAKRLEGEVLTVGGSRLEVGASAPRLLSASTTLYARYVTFDAEHEDEERFMQHAASELRGHGFKFKKILCGKMHRIATAGGPVTTRSLMVADLPFDDSVRLQQQGLGCLRKLGCGLFIAHKSV